MSCKIGTDNCPPVLKETGGGPDCTSPNAVFDDCMTPPANTPMATNIMLPTHRLISDFTSVSSLVYYLAMVAMSNIGNITAITIVATIIPIATMMSGSSSVAISRSLDSPSSS